MTIHCMFGQSGTFKNEFKKLGVSAIDYDILNDFGETDHIIDLNAEIEKAYNNERSIFDTINQEDIIFAFFLCIRFECQQLLWFRGGNYAQQKWSLEKNLEYDIKYHKELSQLYDILSKLVIVCLRRGLKLIIENPYQSQHYLVRYWCLKPSIIDEDRSEHGDYYKKPTMYYFINFEPKNNLVFEPKNINTKRIEKENGATRSLISKQYANWFIRSYILEEGSYEN